MAKVWFITGSSKGFGRIWAEAALERGDSVAATARDTSSLDALVERYGGRVQALELDVTDKAAIDRAVASAHERFGRLDVVVNNAGYGQFGAIEEVSEQEARRQIETNLFGPLWVTKAAVPILRAQGSGHILQVSSIGGVHAFPTIGLYHASKWGLEGFSQSLAYELEDFGVKVTIVEPGGFATDWSGPSAGRAEELSVYDEVRTNRFKRLGAVRGRPGDPQATGPAILELVDAEEPPLRVFLGSAPLEMIRPEYASRIETWERWNELSVRAQGSLDE
ncbi:MAG TPA: SDR family oxidoreductase [Solirubrobacteraceae bacterium]|jgi:NAD(P)-dependent dehydrogenase (short-subunit alcohol dehydrogenase family)|nr:SDR family oxidoreductase [Solirubrobacteraceae bacterium]